MPIKLNLIRCGLEGKVGQTGWFHKTELLASLLFLQARRQLRLLLFTKQIRVILFGKVIVAKDASQLLLPNRRQIQAILVLRNECLLLCFVLLNIINIHRLDSNWLLSWVMELSSSGAAAVAGGVPAGAGALSACDFADFRRVLDHGLFGRNLTIDCNVRRDGMGLWTFTIFVLSVCSRAKSPCAI